MKREGFRPKGRTGSRRSLSDSGGLAETPDEFRYIFACPEEGNLMSKISDLWNRLEKWLAQNAAPILRGLHPPATDEQLAVLAGSTSIELPAEMVEFYKIHNGQDGDSPWLFDGTEFLSTDRIMDEWRVWDDLASGGEFDECETSHPPEICDAWWSIKWLPITYNGFGDHCCVDFDPGPAGTAGQVIAMWHDDDVRTLLALSLAEWFEIFVGEVESGVYELSDTYGGLVRRNE